MLFSLDRVPSSLAHTPKHGLSCQSAARFPSRRSVLLSPLGAEGAGTLPRCVWPAVSLRRCLVPPSGGKTCLHIGILFCRIPLPVDRDTNAPVLRSPDSLCSVPCSGMETACAPSAMIVPTVDICRLFVLC